MQVSTDSIAAALVACVLSVCSLVQATVATTLGILVSMTIEVTVWSICVALFLMCLGDLHWAETCGAFINSAFSFLGLLGLVKLDVIHQHAVVDEVVTAEIILAFFVTLLAIIIQNAFIIVTQDLGHVETGIGWVHELCLQFCLLALDVVLEELPDLFFDGATLLTVGKGGAIVEFVTSQVRWALVPALVATRRLGQFLVLVEFCGVEWTLRPWPHRANLLFALANGPFGECLAARRQMHHHQCESRIDRACHPCASWHHSPTESLTLATS